MGPRRPKLTELRDAERLAWFRKFLTICAMYLSLPLFAVFGVADWIYCPEILGKTLALRLLIVPVCLAVYVSIRRVQSLGWVQSIGTAYTFANSLVITVILYLAQGTDSPYYAGLNLVAIGIGTFVPWTTRFLLLNLVLIYLPFVAWSAVAWKPGSAAAFTTHLFFCVGTVIIAGVIRLFNERLRHGEFVSRIRLQREVDKRDRVIRKKTTEAIRLDSLAKQFSVQVVEAIRRGELDINRPAQNKRLCVVFIDIYESTRAINSIPIENYQNALKKFMSESIPTLLKHDVTYDKTIGDAVMAFSNDPAQHDDFMFRVANAALEIRERIQRNQLDYAAYWGGEFQIKVGIAVGWAEVGFQGDIVKSYTANGPVVNLAARLCSEAGPDEILVAHDAVSDMLSSGFELKPIGRRSLKGFGAVEVHSLIGQSQSTQDWAEVGGTFCPKGHGIMFLDEDKHGLWIMKCRSCDFVLNDPQTARKAA